MQAKPLIADRLSLPNTAVVLEVDAWLSDETSLAWNTAPSEPDGATARTLPRGYFATSQREWRAVVRRLRRCGLGRMLPPGTAPPWRAAGAFAVPKDAGADRLIGDRRGENALDTQPGPVRLPYAPRLRKIVLEPGQGLWVTKRDLSNCFYLFEVAPERLA